MPQGNHLKLFELTFLKVTMQIDLLLHLITMNIIVLSLITNLFRWYPL